MDKYVVIENFDPDRFSDYRDYFLDTYSAMLREDDYLLSASRYARENKDVKIYIRIHVFGPVAFYDGWSEMKDLPKFDKPSYIHLRDTDSFYAQSYWED